VEVIYDLVAFPALVALFVIALVQWQAGLARSHQSSRKVDADNREDRTTATLCSSTEEEKRDVEGSFPSKAKQQLVGEGNRNEVELQQERRGASDKLDVSALEGRPQASAEASDPVNMIEVSALETSQTEVSVIDESPQVILDASNVEQQKQDIDRTMPAGCHRAASCSSPSLPLEETTPLELSSSSPTHFLPEVSVVEYEVSVVESGSPDIKPLLPDSIVESTQPDDSREIFEGDASSPQMDSSCPELQDSRLNSGGSSPPAEYAENGRRRFSDNQDYQLEKVQDHQLQEESEFFRHSLPPSMAFPTAPESPVGPGGMYGAASPPGQMVPACSPPSGSYGYGCGYAYGYASPGVYGPGVYWAGTHAHPGMMIAGGSSPAPGVLMPMYASPEFYGYHGDAYAQQHKSFGGPSTIDRAAAASTQAPCSSPESAGTIFTADGTTAAAMGPYEQHSYEQICHRLQRQYAGAQRGESQGQEDAAHQKETKALKQSKKKKQPKFVRQLDYADSPVLESKEDYASSDSEDSSVDEDEDDICDADSKQPSVTCGGPPKKPAILKQRRAAEKLSKPPGLDDSVVDADPSRTASSSNLFKQQQYQHNAAAVRTPYQNGSGTYNGYNSSAGPSTSTRGTTSSRGAAHHHVVQREAPKPRVQKFISTNNYVPPLPSAPPAKRKKIPTAGIIDQNCNSFTVPVSLLRANTNPLAEGGAHGDEAETSAARTEGRGADAASLVGPAETAASARGKAAGTSPSTGVPATTATARHHRREEATQKTAPASNDMATQKVSTLMVRHLPCKLTFQELEDALAENGFPQNSYDFLYLPQDLINNTNRGYAFINLVDPDADLVKFRTVFCRYQFHKKSSKLAHVVNAHLQGFHALCDHFARTVVKKHKNCIYIKKGRAGSEGGTAGTSGSD